MESLPKRSDDIYKEIESFEDYELTQCVAYEMAIRNDEVAKLYESLGLFKEYVYRNDDAQDAVSCIIDTALSGHGKSQDIELLKSYGINIFEVSFYNMERMICNHENTKRGSAIIYEPENTKITNILNKDELDIVCKNEISSYNNESWVSDEIKIYSNDDFLAFGNSLEYSFCEESDVIIKKASLKKHILNIKNKFSRPKLELDFTSIIKVEVNMALPKEELIAYFAKLKDEHNVYIGDFNEDANKVTVRAKTPLEYLGVELKQANKPPKKKSEKWADMFFIYDYITARQNYIKNENDIIKKKYDEEISNIANNKDVSTKHKKIQKIEVQKEYFENTIDTKITDIFNENKVTHPLKLSGANISKLYYSIKPYIDDFKYKELVTGVSAI